MRPGIRGGGFGSALLTHGTLRAAVGLLLHFLREAEVFHVVSYLLRRSNQPLAESSALSFLQDLEPHRFLCTSFKSMQQVLLTFNDLIKKRLRVLGARMQELGIQAEDVASGWFSQFFVSFLPLHSVFRVLDAFLREGSLACGRIHLVRLPTLQ